MDLFMTIYGVTGLALFEVLRGYRAIMTGVSIVPDGRFLAYTFTLLGFAAATAVCVNLFAGASEIAAVLFGFSLPNGMHWTINHPSNRNKKFQSEDKPKLNDETSSEDDPIDDFFENDAKEHTTIPSPIKMWLSKYYLG